MKRNRCSERIRIGGQFIIQCDNTTDESVPECHQHITMVERQFDDGTWFRIPATIEWES